MTRTWAIVAGVLLVASSIGCGKGGAAEAPQGRARRGPAQYPVEVAAVEVRRVEYQVSAVGSIDAFEQVQVTARVAGVVDRVRFAEGDEVASGARLVDIDPDRYRIAVDSARAVLDRATAAEAEALAGLGRREGLNAKTPGLVREEELETFRTRARTATAELAQSRAALALAEVNLRDAYVRAPVAGTIQTRTVQTGQYVQPGAVLATLLRRDPLLLRFEVSAREAASLSVGTEASLRVTGSGETYTARITHVAAAASLGSRMVPIVAHLEGEGARRLRPGTFAQVSVPVGASEAVVAPQTAIRPSERGFLGFVVEGDVARERVLTLGMRTADGMVEIRDGLRAGDRLVVLGAEALKDGAPVVVAGPRAAPRAADAGTGAPAGGDVEKAIR